MNADTPVCHVSDLVTDVDEGYEYEIQDARVHRAAAQRNYASEMGVDFNKVRLTTAYVHIWSKQDQWDYVGWEQTLDDFISEIADGDDPQIKMAFDPCWKPADYDGDWKWGRHYYVWISDGTEAEDDLRAAVPSRVPDEWEAEEYSPSWEFVDKDHPKAQKVWVCEVKDA